MKREFILLVLMAFASGCTVGPNYKRPTVNVPGSFRGAATPEPSQTQNAFPNTGRLETPSAWSSQTGRNPAGQITPSSEQSVGDQQWWEVFQDQQLQELIRTALKQNYDVRIAATRILQAQAQLGITRADQLPTIGVGASAT